MIPHEGGRDRGVSITLTHVLTLGITTILIGVLLMGSGTMLETETDNSAEHSLETVGERVAGDVASVDRMADRSDNVTITAEHPARVAGTTYEVELLEEDDCDDAPLLDGSTPCLRLTADDADAEVHVPVRIDGDVNASTVRGGTIDIGASGSGGVGLAEGDR